jgi:hypothetical protein
MMSSQGTSNYKAITIFDFSYNKMYKFGSYSEKAVLNWKKKILLESGNRLITYIE